MWNIKSDTTGWNLEQEKPVNTSCNWNKNGVCKMADICHCDYRKDGKCTLNMKGE